MFDGLVAGLTRDRIESFDSGFVDDITNHLFDGDRNGMDLVALNIQRGREHGLAGYNKYRDICGIVQRKACHWGDGRPNNSLHHRGPVCTSEKKETDTFMTLTDSPDPSHRPSCKRYENPACQGSFATTVEGANFSHLPSRCLQVSTRFSPVTVSTQFRDQILEPGKSKVAIRF